MKHWFTIIQALGLILLLCLAGCASKKSVNETPAKKADPVCMEKCQRKKCPDYNSCMTTCDALGTNPRAEPCKVRCQLRLTQCTTGCEAHCNAMQPQ